MTLKEDLIPAFTNEGKAAWKYSLSFHAFGPTTKSVGGFTTGLGWTVRLGHHQASGVMLTATNLWQPSILVQATRDN